MATNKQFKIVIGADAQGFNKAMVGVGKSFNAVTLQSALMKAGVAGAFIGMGNAAVNFVNQAIESAQKLPEGFNATVDALREARTEAEQLDQMIGIMASGSLVQAEKQASKFKKAMLGYTPSGPGAVNGGAAIIDFIWKWSESVEQGELMLDNFQKKMDDVAKDKRLQEQAERYQKVQDRLAKVAAKRSEEEKKLTEQLREKAAAEKLSADFAAWDLAGQSQAAFNTGRDVTPMLSEEDLSGMRDWYAETFDPILLMNFDANLKKINETLTRQQEITQFLGQAFNDMFITALNSGEDFFTQMGAWLENFIKRMAAAAATALLLTAITSGGSAPLSFLGAFKGMLGFTKMAHGGIVDKPTNVQVGEAGPEAIIPLHKLSSLTGGGNLTARISGRDLLIMLDREQSFKKRVYG